MALNLVLVTMMHLTVVKKTKSRFQFPRPLAAYRRAAGEQSLTLRDGDVAHLRSHFDPVSSQITSRATPFGVVVDVSAKHDALTAARVSAQLSRYLTG